MLNVQKYTGDSLEQLLTKIDQIILTEAENIIKLDTLTVKDYMKILPLIVSTVEKLVTGKRRGEEKFQIVSTYLSTKFLNNFSKNPILSEFLTERELRSVIDDLILFANGVNTVTPFIGKLCSCMNVKK